MQWRRNPAPLILSTELDEVSRDGGRRRELRSNKALEHILRRDRSAPIFRHFLFVKNIRAYKVHKKHFKNVDSDMAYLGFPKTALDGILKAAAEKGHETIVNSDDTIVISGFADADGFSDWKKGLENVAGGNQGLSGTGEVFLPIYKTAYDMTLEIFRFSSHFHKDYKHGLGSRLRDECAEMLRRVHLLANGLSNEPNTGKGGMLINEELESVRLYMRILKDMRQVNIKKFITVNKKIEEIKCQLRRIQCGQSLQNS